MLRDYNGLDVGVSDRTTDESDFTHPWKTQIGNILALAKKESLIFFSSNSNTNARFHEDVHPMFASRVAKPMEGGLNSYLIILMIVH